MRPPLPPQMGFVCKGWFSVMPEELPPGDRLVVGLNPPFGVDNHLAEKWIQRAQWLRPRLITLIVPRNTHLPVAQHDIPPFGPLPPAALSPRYTVSPPWAPGAPSPLYRVAYATAELLTGQSFYFPGSVDRSSGQKVLDHNKEPPAFIILVRNDVPTGRWEVGPGGVGLGGARVN